MIFDRMDLKQELTKGEVPGTVCGLSKKGWIDGDLFETWFSHHFLAYAPPVRPLLLLLTHILVFQKVEKEGVIMSPTHFSPHAAIG